MLKGKSSYPVASVAKPVGIEENEDKNRKSIELAVQAVEFEANIAVSYGLRIISMLSISACE